MPGVLSEKVALVTGGGSGIGEAIARRFAAEGAAVVVTGRNPERIGRVAGQIGGLAIPCDVSQEDSVAALIEAIMDHHGRLDILVNNAGVTGPVLSAEEMDMAAFDETMAINVRGVILCIKHAAPHLKRSRGAIINMGSRMGYLGYPMRTPYCASKFATHGITEAVAQELGPFGVRVNALAPGAVSGELMDRVVAARSAKEGRPPDEIIRKNYTDVAALRKWVDPDEVATAALFLASDASSAITGDILKVDAGRM